MHQVGMSYSFLVIERGEGWCQFEGRVLTVQDNLLEILTIKGQQILSTASAWFVRSVPLDRDALQIPLLELPSDSSV